MAKTPLGRRVEREIEPITRGDFEKLGMMGDYIFEIVAPGTRTGVDFCVQVNVYEKGEFQEDDSRLVKKLPYYVKVMIPNLKSLHVPKFFAKLCQEVVEEVRRQEGSQS